MANTKLQLELEAKKMCYFVVGEFFYTLALELFLSGNNIAAGGFSGIGIVVTSFLPISLGLFTFLLNLPFLLLAFFAKGQGYALRTLLGSAIFSILLSLREMIAISLIAKNALSKISKNNKTIFSIMPAGSESIKKYSP